VLDIVDLMACLRSSVGISVSPNFWYHSKYSIPSYARNNWYQSILISLQHIDIRMEPAEDRRHSATLVEGSPDDMEVHVVENDLLLLLRGLGGGGGRKGVPHAEGRGGRADALEGDDLQPKNQANQFARSEPVQIAEGGGGRADAVEGDDLQPKNRAN